MKDFYTVEALKAARERSAAGELSFLKRFGLLAEAKLGTPSACVEEIDYRTARDLDKFAGIPFLPTRGDCYWLAGRITVPQTGPFPNS